MITPTNKNKLLMGVALLLIAASVCAYFLMSGPPRASAPDEAIKAAEEIARQQGREQPKVDGVPADAAGDPGERRRSFGK